MMELAKTAGVDDFNLKFDTSLARGLDYYSGPVFETVLNDLPGIGSVMSGGRYDNLMERFGKASFPATGISLGVDRLVVGLEELGLLQKFETPLKVLFAPLDAEAEKICFRLASQFRREELSCEVYLGDNLKLKKQLNYADHRKAEYSVIIGEAERQKNTAQVKNMTSGEQSECGVEKLLQVIKGI